MASSNSRSSDSDVHQILNRLSSLERSVRHLLSLNKKTAASEADHISNLEHQLEASSSPRLRSAASPGIYPATVGQKSLDSSCVFQMPLHYPRYKRSDYESMPEWQLDRLLQEYGLPIPDSLSAKRDLAIGNLLWGN